MQKYNRDSERGCVETEKEAAIEGKGKQEKKREVERERDNEWQDRKKRVKKRENGI